MYKTQYDVPASIIGKNKENLTGKSCYKHACGKKAMPGVESCPKEEVPQDWHNWQCRNIISYVCTAIMADLSIFVAGAGGVGRPVACLHPGVLQHACQAVQVRPLLHVVPLERHRTAAWYYLHVFFLKPYFSMASACNNNKSLLQH